MKKLIPALLVFIFLYSCTSKPDGREESTLSPYQTDTSFALSSEVLSAFDTTAPENTDETAVTVTTTAETTQITTEVPNDTEPPSPPKADETSCIVWTISEAALYTDAALTDTAEALDADIAVIFIEKGEKASKIATLGGVYYIETSKLTESLPSSAAALMTANGGIYYKGTKELVVIDAGHQGIGMNETEPLGPGSQTMKIKLSSGTQGVATRIPEYVLNLEVSLRLRNELIARGYGVVMIREDHNVTLSNAERAPIANAYSADIFIRIHANGSTNKTVNGAYGICMTKKNQFNASLYTDSLRLSEAVADEFCSSTGVTKKRTRQTDTMTGINWSKIPVTIIEMGYMSNPDEDILMATDEFKNNAAMGIANGIERYFAGK